MIRPNTNLGSSISSGSPRRIARILSEAEKLADEERRIELRFLRHLKRKYPDDDKRITQELADLC